MAQAQKQTSTPSTTRASFRPSDMVQLGLPSNFNGRIARAVACPWDYNGAIAEHVLAARIDFEPDEDSGYEPFSQHYSLGNLKYWSPSIDGETPVDLDGDDISEMEGPYVVWTGPDNVPESGRHLGKGTNFEHFVLALLECGYKEENIGDDLTWLEGIVGYWVRVGQKKREGLKGKDGKESNEKQILVCAELKESGGSTGKPKGGKSATAKGSKTEDKKSAGGKPNGSSASSTDLDTQVADATVSVLRDMNGSGKFTEVRGRVFKSFKGADAAKALKLFNSDDFHAANEELWASEGKEGELTLLEE